jgi:hypothetical protein
MKVSKWLKRFTAPKTPAYARVIRNLAQGAGEPVELTLHDLETKATLHVYLTAEEAKKLGQELLGAACDDEAATYRQHRPELTR